jgi:hypothetical protein
MNARDFMKNLLNGVQLTKTHWKPEEFIILNDKGNIENEKGEEIIVDIGELSSYSEWLIKKN